MLNDEDNNKDSVENLNLNAKRLPVRRTQTGSTLNAKEEGE